jgi:hypothetical protein
MAGIEKLISGAQSGADRAALDFAIDHRIPHGGWCPLGRKAEDGTIDPRYELQETPSSGYVQRTEWNVRDSDGTVVFSIAPVLTGVSKKTVELAHKHRKPVIHIARDGGPASPAQALPRAAPRLGVLGDGHEREKQDYRQVLHWGRGILARRTPQSKTMVRVPFWPEHGAWHRAWRLLIRDG